MLRVGREESPPQFDVVLGRHVDYPRQLARCCDLVVIHVRVMASLNDFLK